MRSYSGPEIDTPGLRAALEGSLEARGFLAKGDGPLRLDARLVAVEFPSRFPTVIASVTIDYTLRRAGRSKPVHTAFLSAEHEVGLTLSTLNANTRLRMATEGAVRANVSQFLETLEGEARRAPRRFR